MKIYRQPIRKSNIAKITFAVLILSIPLLSDLLYNNFGSIFFLNFIYITIGVIFIFIFIAVFQLFYLIITPQRIFIKNSILGFWKKEAKFDDEIRYVILGNTGGASPDYIQLVTFEQKSKRYVIDLVHFKTYKSLIMDLETKGVKVEVKGIAID